MGHYKAEEWAADDNKWIINDRLGIQITVDVGWPAHISRQVVHRGGQADNSLIYIPIINPLTPTLKTRSNSDYSPTQETETEERIVNTRGAPEGKFVFTSHIAGDHSICLKSNYTGGWVCDGTFILSDTSV